MAAKIQWESLPEMKTNRADHGMAAMDGKLYVTAAGGWDGCDALNTGEVLDLATMQWESLPEMSIYRSGHGMVAMDGKLYVADDMVLDLATMQWEHSRHDMAAMEKTIQWELLPKMNVERSGHGMAAMDGKLYVTGGYVDINIYKSHKHGWSSDDHDYYILKTGSVLAYEEATECAKVPDPPLPWIKRWDSDVGRVAYDNPSSSKTVWTYMEVLKIAKSDQLAADKQRKADQLAADKLWLNQ